MSKTKIPNADIKHISYSYAISTSVPAALNQKTPIAGTGQSSCGRTNLAIRVPKKSKYGAISVGYASYYTGCGGFGYSEYYIDYQLIKEKGFGKTDTFTATEHWKFVRDGVTYRVAEHDIITVVIGTKPKAE